MMNGFPDRSHRLPPPPRRRRPHVRNLTARGGPGCAWVAGVTVAVAFALLGAGVLAGLASTVAALASVVSYPALLAAGLPPVSANVTNTVALVFTGAGAAAGSRRELAGLGPVVRGFGLVTALGGAAGAALLLLTPARSFQDAAPVLIGCASLLLIVQPLIGGLTPRPGGEHRWWSRAGMFAVAIYIGYFGAAGGIVMLVVLSGALDLPLVRVNAVKNVVLGLANAAAAVGFAVFGPVRWSAALPLAVGFLVGGWLGPAVVRRLPARLLRVAIGCAGLAVAITLAVRTYR
jgi:uncharacterized membrane protein YfcA